MAAPQVAAGMMTEGATATGALAQGMRLTEELVKGSFRQNEANAGFASTMIDRSMRRQSELEFENRELFTALKLVVVEFDKHTHSMRLAEIREMRAAQFQKSMMAALPILVNMASGTGDVFPPMWRSALSPPDRRHAPEGEGGRTARRHRSAAQRRVARRGVAEKVAESLRRQEADKLADERLMQDCLTGLSRTPQRTQPGVLSA